MVHRQVQDGGGDLHICIYRVIEKDRRDLKPL